MKNILLLSGVFVLLVSCRKESSPLQSSTAVGLSPQDTTNSPPTPADTADPLQTPVDYYVSGTIRQYDVYNEEIQSAPTSIQVSLEGTSYSIHCNSNGYFILDSLPAGYYTVVVTKPGFGVSKRYVHIGTPSGGFGLPPSGGNWANHEIAISQIPTWGLTIGPPISTTQIFYMNGGVSTNGQVEQGFRFPITTDQLAPGRLMDINVYYSTANNIDPMDTATYEYFDLYRCPGYLGTTDAAVAYSQFPSAQSGDTIFYKVCPISLGSQYYYGTGGLMNYYVRTAINTNSIRSGFMIIP